MSALSTSFGPAAPLPAREFAHPEIIHYDAQCLTIRGRDTFIYSGAFHYFRCPKPLWRDRFQKIKEAGFNTVETYVPWNWHEQEMPAGFNDFSKVDLTDLDDWLNMAQEFGFYIIIRPGPYICAEWDNGGFPRWLLTKKPAALKDKTWLRSDDPVFLAWSKHWFDEVCPVIARHQITRVPEGRTGIILFQLENEYDYAGGFSEEVKSKHIRTLAKTARADGIDVPLTTCWTHCVRGKSDPLMRQVFDSCNFYPRWDVDSTGERIEQLRREQPDAPLMTTELQGGWFQSVNGKADENLDGLTPAQINSLTLFTIQHGETILNYYMLFGGTNPGDRAARNITTSYDYNAPIREWGSVGERYQRVKAIGQMLIEHGARLARSQEVECDVTVPQKDVSVVMRRASDGGRYLFVRTSQHAEPREGMAKVKEKSAGATELVFRYSLEPFGSMILHLPPGVSDAANGEWLPKPAPAIEPPASLPASVTITSVRSQADPGPEHWKNMKSGRSLEQMGIYDSGFVFYRIKAGSSVRRNLLVEHPSDDVVVALVDGKPVFSTGGSVGTSDFALTPDARPLDLLYENLGYVNGGNDMEQPAGILSARAAARPLSDQTLLDGWKMREVDKGNDRPEVQADFDDKDWSSVAVDKSDPENLPAHHTAVFRRSFEISSADLQGGSWLLKFGDVDDLGWVYVNGIQAGETRDWSRSYSFDVTKRLHAGRNEIAVVVSNNDGNGGLGMPGIRHEPKGAYVRLKAFGLPAGVEGRWWEPGFDDSNWRTSSLPETEDQTRPSSLLTWYRMNFKLSEKPTAAQIPWRLHLEATGNGFLYLNGHAIGRYWEAGSQHDFFLPECWLNFGEGTNVLTLSLRATEKGASIQSVVVESYDKS